MKVKKIKSHFLAATAALLGISAIALPLTATAQTFDPKPILIDDDGSQDGLAAFAYMLADPRFKVEALTMSHGVAQPENEGFQTGLKKMLGFLDATDIPVGIGSSVPLEGNNAFPDFVRQDADKFYAPFVTLPDEVPDIEFESAAELIVETVKSSPEPITILSAGSLTNIAEALRIDPTIVDNIEVIQMMGGAVFVDGNVFNSTNDVAEFNIWLDSVAAQEVFDAANEQGLKIQLAPLDGTNKLQFSRDDYEAWLATGTPESTITAQFLDYSLVVVSENDNPSSLWDIQAAINLSEPDFSNEVPLHIEIDTESAPGETQGQTNSIEGLPPNALVSFDQSFDNLPFTSAEVFSYLEELKKGSASVHEPNYLLGLLAIGSIGIGNKIARKKLDK